MHEPSNQRAGEAENRGEGSGSPALLVPEEGKGSGQHSGRDDDTHKKVEVTHRDTDVVQSSGETGHGECVDDDASVGSIDESAAAGVGVEVLLVDIIGEDGGNGNQLSRHGRSDSHEDQEQCSGSTTASQHSDGGSGENQASRDISGIHAVWVGGEDGVALEREGSKTHGSGSQPRDGEPGQTTGNVARKGMDWVGGNGLVVVTVIAEDGTEVADNVDNEEDSTLLGLHGEVASASIVLNRMPLGGLNEEVVDLAGAADNAVCVTTSGIGGERKDQNDDQNDDGVGIVGKEGSLDTTEHGIEDDTNWEQETSRSGGNTGQRSDDSRATSQQHGSDQDVCHQSKDDENEMGVDAITGLDDLKERMCVGSAALQLNCNGCKQNDLYRGTRRVPEGAGDTTVQVLVNVFAAKMGGGWLHSL